MFPRAPTGHISQNLKVWPCRGLNFAEWVQEWESAKVRQDKALDNIEKGLGVLKGLGEAMGETLNQQDVLLQEIDTKVVSYPMRSRKYLLGQEVPDEMGCHPSLPNTFTPSGREQKFTIRIT